MTPSLDNGEFIEASFGWCISCKYSSVFFTPAKIACLCFVCFPVPKKVAGDWMLAPFFVAKCASCKALAQNPVKHTCWIWTYNAPQRIGNNNLIGMLKHTHTHIRVSLLAQAQSLDLSIVSQHQSTALHCLEPRGGGMRQIDDTKTQLLPSGKVLMLLLT